VSGIPDFAEGKCPLRRRTPAPRLGGVRGLGGAHRLSARPYSAGGTIAPCRTDRRARRGRVAAPTASATFVESREFAREIAPLREPVAIIPALNHATSVRTAHALL